jgi:hypothetical protein
MTYGSTNSAILSADLGSVNNPQLATIMMQRQGQGEGMTSAQSTEKGLPTKINPVQLSLEVIGCPLFRFSQQFFVDFGTGTTADNVYAVTSISHKFAPGSFQTSLGLVQLDTFGQYETMLNVVEKAIAEIQQAKLDEATAIADKAQEDAKKAAKKRKKK